MLVWLGIASGGLGRRRGGGRDLFRGPRVGVLLGDLWSQMDGVGFGKGNAYESGEGKFEE